MDIFFFICKVCFHVSGSFRLIIVCAVTVIKQKAKQHNGGAYLVPGVKGSKLVRL